VVWRTYYKWRALDAWIRNVVVIQEWMFRGGGIATANMRLALVVKNWNGLSFAAGRLVLSDAKRSTEVDQRILREMWLCRVWARMVEEAVIVGEVDVDPRDYLAAPWAFTRHTWIPPKWEYALTPGEEVSADLDEIAGNLATVEDKLGKRGHDLEDFIARREREVRLLRKAGLAETPVRPTVGRPPSTNVSPETRTPDEVPA
jgi:capsid protein